MHRNSLAAAAVALVLAWTIHLPAHGRETHGEPRVDRKAGVPRVLSFDVRAGYFDHVLSPVSRDEEEETALRIRLAGPTDVEWTEGVYRPTVALCLKPADRDARASYCTNVTLQEPTRLSGSARMFSEQGERMFEKLARERLDPARPTVLRIVRKGMHVTTSVNDEVIDEGELAFVPAYWSIGASTGVARIEALDQPKDEVPLGPAQWPRTLEAAVAEATALLSANDRRAFRDMTMDQVLEYWIGWGTTLRDRQGLSRGNDDLRVAVCGKDCTADDAARAIMVGVWVTLRDPPGT